MKTDKITIEYKIFGPTCPCCGDDDNFWMRVIDGDDIVTYSKDDRFGGPLNVGDVDARDIDDAASFITGFTVAMKSCYGDINVIEK